MIFRASRAFTILEVMVAGLLLLMLMTMAIRVIRPTTRAFDQGSTQMDLQREAGVTLEQLAAHLRAGNPAGVGLKADGSALALTTLSDFTPDGHRVWSTEVQVYYWDSVRKELHHKRYDGSVDLGITRFAGRPTQLSPAQLQSIIDEAAIPHRLLLSGVENFVAEPDGGGRLQSRLSLSLELARDDRTGRRHTLSLRRVEQMRNRW